jgi:hypothetical protein
VSVRLSTRTNCCCHWKNFHEIWCKRIFRKYVGKIHVTLKIREE